MKARELTDATVHLPGARIAVDLPDGRRVNTTGFVIREDKAGKPVIVLKVPNTVQRKGKLE